MARRERERRRRKILVEQQQTQVLVDQRREQEDHLTHFRDEAAFARREKRLSSTMARNEEKAQQMLQVGQRWAGPGHWKFHAAAQPKAGGGAKVTKVVDVPPRVAEFGCEQFGSLCPPLGAGVLSPHDVQFARSRRLKVFVYRDLPASFHDKIIQDGLPAEVRSGQVCDFFSAPCSPSGKPALMRRLENWFTTMKNVPDAPLLTKLAGGLKSFQVQPDAPLAQ